MKSFGKCLRDQQRKNDSCISIHFHRLCIYPNLAPRDCLIWISTTVTAVKRLSCVHKDREVRTIPEEVCIANVVLRDSCTTKSSLAHEDIGMI